MGKKQRADVGSAGFIGCIVVDACLPACRENSKQIKMNAWICICTIYTFGYDNYSLLSYIRYRCAVNSEKKNTRADFTRWFNRFCFLEPTSAMNYYYGTDFRDDHSLNWIKYYTWLLVCPSKRGHRFLPLDIRFHDKALNNNHCKCRILMHMTNDEAIRRGYAHFEDKQSKHLANQIINQNRVKLGENKVARLSRSSCLFGSSMIVRIIICYRVHILFYLRLKLLMNFNGGMSYPKHSIRNLPWPKRPRACRALCSKVFCINLYVLLLLFSFLFNARVQPSRNLKG